MDGARMICVRFRFLMIMLNHFGCMHLFESAKRPLLVMGWGIHVAHAESEAVEFAHRFNIPTVCTWAAADLFHCNDALYAGVFGTHGVRYANFAVQNADVILTIYREEMYRPAQGVEGATELILAKNRNGPTGFVDLYFYPRWLRFVDMLDAD